MELEEFLKSKGALVSFCKNMRQWIKNISCRKELILGINSFYWATTPEGHNYWEKIYHEFIKVPNRRCEKTAMYYASHKCLNPPKSFKAI